MVTELEVHVAEGFVIRVDTTEAIGRALAVTGRWEPHVVAAFRRLLSPGDVCMDVGANIGFLTLLASKLVGPAGHVYALEPAAEPFAALEANVALNGFENVTALRLAAGDAAGEAVFDDRPSGHSLRSYVRRAEEPRPAAGSGTFVRVEPAASLVRDEHLRRLRLVKIDVEGYDVEALRGLLPLFESGARPALIVELHPQAPAAVPLLRELSERYGLQGYRLYDDDRPDKTVPWLVEPVELTSPLELGREPHVLLLAKASG
jgi:FkbM family methyltransferase